MLLRFDATMNGQSISQIDPALTLRDIIELDADVDKQYAPRAIHPGTRISARVRRSTTVRLVYIVRERDVAARTAIINKLADWAGEGGWLTISTRPDMRLRVEADQSPRVDSALKWTQDLTLDLTAYSRPYWEDMFPVQSVITEKGVIRPRGTYPIAYVQADITNTGSGALTTCEVTCGDTKITLNDLVVAPGEHVTISYDDDDILHITAGGFTALDKRTAASHDDLVAMTRVDNTISVSCDQPVCAVFYARGRYR